jgi:RecB family endonuclease NucS
MVGKLKRVRLREVWKNEAKDFTCWLQDNIDVLNEVLDISLSSPEREQDAGNFSVDLVAEDQSGNPVIIENQLEKSNHDHLGKVITYLTAIEAKTAI